MGLKILPLILIIALFSPYLIHAQVDCIIVNPGDPEVSECEADENCYLGSAGGRVLVCYAEPAEEPECAADTDCGEGYVCEDGACIEEPVEVVEEIPEEVIEEPVEVVEEIPEVPLPENVEVAVEIVGGGPGTTSPSGESGGISLGVSSVTTVEETGEEVEEKAEVKYSFVKQEVSGIELEAPKIDLNLEVKTLTKIPQTLDLDLVPYAGYILFVLFAVLIILSGFLAKDLVAPRLDYRNKRGQIFLIAAVVLILALYTVSITYNSIRTYPEPENYKEVSENYQGEFPKVFNWALYNGLDRGVALQSFNTAFMEEARQIDPNFGAFYIFKDQSGNLNIVNTLNERALRVTYEREEERGREISLASADGTVSGTICTVGADCVRSETRVSNYDNAYFHTTIDIEDIIELRIQSGFTSIPIPIEQFTSMTYTMSENTVPLDEPTPISNIGVALIQY